MDAVKAFNAELSALYEVKPPISKAKMSSITRSAIKAIKFYKHVVQSVEKFIQKCKPEYKVPGLYVIDSIVRQSRHQFGPDKDLFAPRFAKNMQNTFANLFSCPPEDKGKIIRVLNLWQKNSVFTPDVIQPLFDQLADPNNPIHRETVTASNGLTATGDRTSPSNISKGSGIAAVNKSAAGLPADSNAPHWLKSQLDATNKAIMELTSSSAQQAKASGNSGLDLLQQIQQLQQFILSQTTQKQERTQSEQVVFDKKLLDFDYDDDDEENPSPHQQTNNADNFNSILQNPEILRQLTALQQQMSQHQLRQQQLEIEEKMRKLKEMKQQEEEFDKHLAQTVPKLPFASECDLKQYQEPAVTTTLPDLSVPPPGYPKQPHRDETHDSEVECIDDESNDRERNVEVINLLDRSPSSSPSQTSSRRRHSRSRSRDRRRSRRSRSRSRSRTRSPRSKRKRRTRSRSRDRVYDSEKDRERRKKGLPPIKRNHLSVCSTTLWVGHLSKLVQQEELSDTFGEFGDIVSIDVIPPRGCAFICMNRRQDAARALTRLKDYKLHGKNIMLAWAPGKGVKGRDYKDYWEIDLGVSYIPWSRLSKKTDFVALEEGGALDEDTMPDSLKETILEQLQKRKDELQAGNKLMEDMPATPSYIPLPEGIPAPPVPPVLAATLPGVMTVPPPILGASNSPAAPNIDTSQPPPNMSPNSKAAGGLGVLSGPSLTLPQLGPRIPVMAKPGIMMPPFSFTSLPPPLGIGVPNMMGNLPIGVPPPTMQGLLMQQQMMAAIPTTAASAFPPGTMLPPMSVSGGPNMRDKVSGMPLGPDVCGTPFDRHPLHGPSLGMGNHKEDDSMDLEDEAGDDEKSRLAKNAQSLDKLSNDDRSRDEARNDDRNRDDRGRDRDRSDRDRERDRRDRGRDRDKDRDYRDRERDYRDRGRDRDRRRRSRDRDDRRSRDRDYHNRSRDRDNRRDRSRTNDRDRNRDSKVRDKESEGDSRDDSKRDENKKEPVNQWVEVPMTNEEKPSLLQRLRNIAEGGSDVGQRPEGDGSMFGTAMPRMNEPGSRHGPPIIINLNNSGMPRPGFGPRGPMGDVFRPEFGPGPRPNDFGPCFGPGDRISPGRQFDEDDCRRQGFRGGMGPERDDRGRSRFDFGGPRPLMEAHFDGPPVHPEDLRGGPMHPDDMRGPMDGMMCPPDEMRGPGMFVDDFQPMGDDMRMRFGPRALMGPMPRGPMGPHGPGPVSLFGPRGPGIRPLMGRPPNIWMDNNAPNLGDNFTRPPFDDRPGGPGSRRGPGPGPGSAPRFRGERTRDRQSRWSKEDVKEPVGGKRSEPDKKETESSQEENEVEVPPRDSQTPCHDEQPEPEPEPMMAKPEGAEPRLESNAQDAPMGESAPQIVEQQEYERDTQTPLHDEPQIPDIVSQREEPPPPVPEA
ncbi:UNVERIFIED_CONTAM: hypothetical protein PYX00_003778 [Menopon gallinae]|uniref:Uncharacterized protein n=2 Tax=Menopon gallinae TaxID=328185 RepID=A0AAW2I1Z6_9NEOP